MKNFIAKINARLKKIDEIKLYESEMSTCVFNNLFSNPAKQALEMFPVFLNNINNFDFEKEGDELLDLPELQEVGTIHYLSQAKELFTKLPLEYKKALLSSVYENILWDSRYNIEEKKLNVSENIYNGIKEFSLDTKMRNGDEEKIERFLLTKHYLVLHYLKDILNDPALPKEEIKEVIEVARSKIHPFNKMGLSVLMAYELSFIPKNENKKIEKKHKL